MSQFKTNLCCSNKQSANFAVNRKEELFSFSISVHLQVGISSAPHQLHPQSPAEEQAPHGALLVPEQRRRRTQLSQFLHRSDTSLHTSLAKMSHMANPDVSEAEK